MRWLAYCLALLLFQHAWAQDVVDVAEEEETIDLGVVVVEAGALPAPADEEPAPVETATPESEPTIVEQLRESSATTVISGEQLRDAASVADALERIPGADIRRSGGAGQLDTVLLRGARAQQVLVLVDGAPLMPGQVADLALLPAHRRAHVDELTEPPGGAALGAVPARRRRPPARPLGLLPGVPGDRGLRLAPLAHAAHAGGSPALRSATDCDVCSSTRSRPWWAPPCSGRRT